eukprot:scaffold243399_cov53-Attheya_sp.AAC.1
MDRTIGSSIPALAGEQLPILQPFHSGVEGAAGLSQRLRRLFESRPRTQQHRVEQLQIRSGYRRLVTVTVTVTVAVSAPCWYQGSVYYILHVCYRYREQTKKPQILLERRKLTLRDE